MKHTYSRYLYFVSAWRSSCQFYRRIPVRKYHHNEPFVYRKLYYELWSLSSQRDKVLQCLPLQSLNFYLPILHWFNWISSNFSDFIAQSSKHLCSKVPFLSYKISIFTFMKIVCEGRYIDTLYFLLELEEEKISLIVSWLSLFYSPQLEMGPIYHATPFWFSLLPHLVLKR